MFVHKKLHMDYRKKEIARTVGFQYIYIYNKKLHMDYRKKEIARTVGFQLFPISICLLYCRCGT